MIYHDEYFIESFSTTTTTKLLHFIKWFPYKGKTKRGLSRINNALRMYLMEYYEIVGESRPLSDFFPTNADLFTEMHFQAWNQAILQVSERSEH